MEQSLGVCGDAWLASSEWENGKLTFSLVPTKKGGKAGEGGRHSQLLRNFMLEDPEVKSILAAID